MGTGKVVGLAIAGAALVMCVCGAIGIGAVVHAADAAKAEVSPSAGDEAAEALCRDGLTLPQLRGSADAVNAFSVKLFTLLAAAEPSNLVLSPYSLESVLLMAAYGARGETRREMLDALALSPPHPVRYDASAHAAFARLTRILAAIPDQFSVSNLAAHDRRLVPPPEYVAGLRDLYRAEILPKDFSDSAGAASEINAWAAEGTRGGIRHIVSPGDITADTRLMLLNAVVFAGEWADAFPPENTREGDFAAADGAVAVKYMSHLTPLTVLRIRGAAPAGEAGGGKRLASLAALPFRGGEWEMLLFATESVADFLAELTPETLCAWLSEYDAARGRGEVLPIQVELPKFAFSGEAKDLIPALKRMGMARAFDAGGADFSGLSGGDGPLALSLIRHKARIEVDEAGARAAAVSVAAVSKSLVERFSLRRPFVFMVRHVSTGAVVMLGRVARPVEE
ncbi:MAG: serpin family protein [Planctomycetota bacterium]|jgi:serpin B|nr:serpin family protein [Planctomycetota bacterium]